MYYDCIFSADVIYLIIIHPEAFIMEFSDFQLNIAKFLPQTDMKFYEPMSKHTSFQIGGNAEVMAFPKSPDELASILSYCNSEHIIPKILGAGTNVLASDEGIKGLVICLKDCIDGIKQSDSTHILAMAGVTMTRLAMFAAKCGLSGLEFSHGIPGTVGGGVYMNAGAYGGEIADVCTFVWVMNYKGEIRKISKEDMAFSYRHSALEDSGEIVVKVEFCLKPAESDAIIDHMMELKRKRIASQPLDYPSAGSAFKRPAGGYAAALIDTAGLKGYRVGNAGISEKHAGFAVNLGGATASEVRQLLFEVSDKVYLSSGIRLEPEIRIW